MTRRKRLVLFVIITAALAAVLLCGYIAADKLRGCSSCSEVMDTVSVELFGEGEQEYVELKVTLPRHSGYAPIEDKNGYEALATDDERQAYLSMEQSLFRLTAEDGGDHGEYQLCRALIPSLSSVQIFKVKEALKSDHPEAFWFNGRYTLGRNGHDGLYVILYSSLSAEEVESAAGAIYRRVGTMLGEIPSGLNEYDRELYVHDMIVRDVEYDHAAAENMAIVPEAATIYGALIEGRAVCTGYAFTTKLLLNRVGISCMTVDGTLKDDPDNGHIWNIVSIGGEWYHLDITNNDPTGYSADNIRSYNYFNLTDSAIKITHDIAPNYVMLSESTIEWGTDAINAYNFTLPKCNSSEWNYYNRNATRISKLNDEGQEQIYSIMQQCSLSGKDMFYLIFDDEVEADIISEWVESFVVNDIGRINKENDLNNTKYIIDKCKYGQGASQKWCNVYIFKLVLLERPAI
ncbi:MAG: hypothetical protein E7554_03040 [Ruminococcaceae bacterium]|nr:hypothetical protein [Oscillospiraceae bacterium]